MSYALELKGSVSCGSSCCNVAADVDFLAGSDCFRWLSKENLTRLLMLQRLLRQLQHVVTALVLLISILVGAELWLRNTRPASTTAVATQADIVNQSWLVPSATQHHQMRPLSDVVSDNGAVRFRTNSMGMRGPEPDLQAAEGTLRILVLGDDTVAGAWLKDEHTLSVQLQRHLTANLAGPVEVLNAGVPGYSPVLSVLRYNQDLARLRPDVVVLHFDMSDVADETIHRASLRVEGTRDVCIHPLLTHSGKPKNSLLAICRNSSLVDIFSERFFSDSGQQINSDRYAWTRSSPRSIQTQIRHAMSSVARLQKVTQSSSQTLVMTTAPVCWQVQSPDQNPEVSHRYGMTGGQPVTDDVPFRVLAAWSRQANVPLCNSVKAFRNVKSPEKLFCQDSARLSEYGTALYAQELAITILQTSAAVAGGLKSVH